LEDGEESEEGGEEEEAVAASSAAPQNAATAAPPAGRKKKGKEAKKKSTAKYQWQILEEIGVPKDEIIKFTDPVHWLYYFPPIGRQDLESFGCAIDFRRSFITTEANPFYDSFIRWHFNTLIKEKKLAFGAR